MARSHTPPKWEASGGLMSHCLPCFFQESCISLTTFSRSFDESSIMPSFLAPRKLDPALSWHQRRQRRAQNQGPPILHGAMRQKSLDHQVAGNGGNGWQRKCNSIKMPGWTWSPGSQPILQSQHLMEKIIKPISASCSQRRQRRDHPPNPANPPRLQLFRQRRQRQATQS